MLARSDISTHHQNRHCRSMRFVLLSVCVVSPHGEVGAVQLEDHVVIYHWNTHIALTLRADICHLCGIPLQALERGPRHTAGESRSVCWSGTEQPRRGRLQSGTVRPLAESSPLPDVWSNDEDSEHQNNILTSFSRVRSCWTALVSLYFTGPVQHLMYSLSLGITAPSSICCLAKSGKSARSATPGPLSDPPNPSSLLVT